MSITCDHNIRNDHITIEEEYIKQHFHFNKQKIFRRQEKKKQKISRSSYYTFLFKKEEVNIPLKEETTINQIIIVFVLTNSQII